MNNTPLTQEKAEQFVRFWQRSTSGAAVARLFGISRQRAHQIATRMREAGIPLKGGSYDKRRERVENNWDVEKLKQITQEENLVQPTE